MRFKQVVPHVPWSAEKTQARIDSTLADIKLLNQGINRINSQLNDLNHKREAFCVRAGRKSKYLNQLRKQLQEPKQ